MSGGSYPGMTPGEQAAYDQGYRDGENSAAMDWSWALTEFTDLPDDVDRDSAHAVAAYMVPLVEFAQLVLDNVEVERGSDGGVALTLSETRIPPDVAVPIMERWPRLNGQEADR